MLFDSHCHLNFSSFADDYQKIIADCLKKGIGVVNIGSQYDTSKRAVEIANQYPDKPIYASIGLHPIHLSKTEVDPAEDGASEKEIKFISREEKFDEKKYQPFIDKDKSGKIVAVGETGLDYWHKFTENKKTQKTQKTLEKLKELQKDEFVAQLKFAAKNKLPVILHARGSKENLEDVYNDMLDILKLQITNYQLPIAGVIHCFGSTKEIAQKFLDLGFYIGFTGIITFKNKSVDELREVVKMAPLDKILVETDAPYLAPEPHRGEKNKPQYVEFVARKVAEIKNISYEEVCKATTENFKSLFLTGKL